MRRSNDTGPPLPRVIIVTRTVALHSSHERRDSLGGWVGVIRVVLTIPATQHQHCYAVTGWPRCVEQIQRNFIIQAIIHQKVVIRRDILREFSRTQTFSYLVIQGWENHGSYFERTDITLQPVCKVFMQRMPC